MTDIELNILKNRYEVVIIYDKYFGRYFVWLKASFVLNGTKDHFFITSNGVDDYDLVNVSIFEWFKNFYPKYIRTIKVKTILEN